MTHPSAIELARLSTDVGSLPGRMRKLPLDDAGRPVPYFVAIIDGKPDHRIVDALKWRPALQYNLCWICGDPMGGRKSFAIGPMCTVNRVSAEPGQHYECSVWSATHCPFLVNPSRGRREGGLPGEDSDHKLSFSDVGIGRNPGVTAVWTTKKTQPFSGPNRELLVRLGEPESVEWFCMGRAATRTEVMDSVETGLPALEEVALEEGPKAMRSLALMVADAEQWWPEDGA